MYELIQLSEHDYYIDCPAKIGIVKLNATDVITIDSGSDKDAGKKVFRIAEENGWKIKAIYNTHSHADHIGGNKFLQTKTGCEIFSYGSECCFTNHPFLEPSVLYGGNPFPDIKHKFLMAQESIASPICEEKLPEGLRLIRLPGHSFDMVGFLTADGNAFIADSLASKETLEKYAIVYLWDVEKYLGSLESLKGITAKKFVPSHAQVTDDITALAQYNIDSVHSVIDKILSLCTLPVNFDTLLQAVFNEYNISANAQQYVLVGSTLRSYLSYLNSIGKLELSFENNVAIWKKPLKAYSNFIDF